MCIRDRDNLMISRTTLMLSTAFAALAAPGMATAQEAAVAATAETATAEATQDPASEANADSEDPTVIVVTAQRRVQTLLEVPQSISVVGGETLERQQATSFA